MSFFIAKPTAARKRSGLQRPAKMLLPAAVLPTLDQEGVFHVSAYQKKEKRGNLRGSNKNAFSALEDHVDGTSTPPGSPMSALEKQLVLNKFKPAADGDGAAPAADGDGAAPAAGDGDGDALVEQLMGEKGYAHCINNPSGPGCNVGLLAVKQHFEQLYQSDLGNPSKVADLNKFIDDDKMLTSAVDAWVKKKKAKQERFAEKSKEAQAVEDAAAKGQS
ncbi:unnamed protein product [Amoebophrya sp. A120]|nr:unnamed protein product [Amoebophrya sp. A120]|eukprot:GSA120T00007772001.1